MAKKEFGLGNMADDLVSLTLELCGKADDRNPRFPRLFYPSFVTRTINTALDIQEFIIEANEIRIGEARRTAQQQAAAKCVYLNHLGWRHHALKAKNARTQVLNMDAYLDGALRQIGCRLIIYKVDHGKIKWRVSIAPDRR